MDPDPSFDCDSHGVTTDLRVFFGHGNGICGIQSPSNELQSQHSLRESRIVFNETSTDVHCHHARGNNLALVLCGIESATLISEGMFGVSGWQFASNPCLS